MLVSFAIKKDMYSIVILNPDGKLSYETCRFSSEIGDDKYKRSLFTFRKAIIKIRGIIEANPSDEVIPIETTNSTLIKWFQRESANDTYAEEFDKLLADINTIPMKYVLVHNKEPRAMWYLNEKYIKGSELVGMSALMDM